ncbi:MAG: ABC transporter ATP-binding protein [Candidatus Omnitrophota bacterium]
MKVINFNGVWEKYRIKFIKQKNVCWEETWVLEDIDFEAEKGEVVGVVGRNGAGKTTLLKLIAGMLVPDRGEISVVGKVSVLMELGAGFNPEFTGRENIILNAAIYGLNEADLKQRMDGIVEFADLGKFIDAPIKYYSQGMYMRLAFALAIYVEPDILLIDDILAVGDEGTQRKCIKKIFELKQMGKTIILVSHDINMVSKLCNRLILLEKGKIIQEGLATKVIPYYLETVGNRRGIAVLEKERLRAVFNNGKVAVNYNGFSLTKTTGGYVSFFVPLLNSWLPSFDLSWQVRRFGTDKIIVEGKSQEGILLQIWTLQIEKDRLRWEVEAKDAARQQPHIDLNLIPQYKRWQTLDKSSDFPLFGSKSNWQNLSLNSCPDAILGLSGDWQTQSCPGLILEQKDKNILLKLFNTGYEQESRVVQWDLGAKNKIFVSIKIFSEKDKFADYIKNTQQLFFQKQEEENQKLLREQQKECARLRVLRTISGDGLRLYADVANKALRLYYKEKEITKGLGLHSSFLLKNVWYDSSSCQWQVKKKNNTLVLHLYWEQWKFKQLWKFSLKDNALQWQINSQNSGTLKLKLFKFGLLLNSQYKGFFCGRQQDSFPDQFTDWQDMPLIEPQAELCGLRKQADFPAVILDNKKGYACIIQNSDRQTQCRALQLSISKNNLSKSNISFSTKITLFEEESSISDYLKQQRQLFLQKQEEENQKLLREQQAERARLCAQRTIASGSLRLFADTETKSLRLFYKDKEITRGRGLNSSFLIKTDWYDLSFGQWQLKKISDQKFILSVDYESLFISQVWILVCQKNALMIKIRTKFNKPILISNQLMFLHLCSRYEKWESTYEHGNFLNEQYIGDIAPVRLKDNKITEILFKSGNKADLPKLVIYVFSQPERRTMSIHRYKQANDKVLCVNSSLIVHDQEKSTELGNTTCFEGKIVLGEKLDIKKNTRKINSVKLVDNNLEFIFNQGKGGISLSGKELTSGLGVYTSIRSSGVWYDSYQAFWRVNQKKNNQLKVTGYWPQIAILQVWQIKMAGDNLIFWQVNMEVSEQLDLEICQTNIMLCPQYKNWVVSNYGYGKFLDEYTQRYDILPFRFWYGKGEEIIAKADTEALPRISFKNDMKTAKLRAIVENTDNLYQARLLQYQKENVHKLLPGKYSYFKGIIKIEP